VTPAIRLPLRRLPRPSVIASVGAGIVILSAVFSLAGLPAPAGIAQGAGDVASGSPDASDSPAPSSPTVPAGVASSKRHALAEADLCARGPRTIEPAAVAFHGSRDDKVVALTFDDGWGGRSLRRILRTLQDKHVNATFFPVGQAVRHDPRTWKMIAAAGFPIADHTYDHATLAGKCYLAQRLELSRARTAYANVLGITPLPVMRPPGGEFDAATRVAATAAGEPTLVLWDVDTEDWMGIGARQVQRNARAGTKGSIIVMHTSSFATVRALPGIIRDYRKRGYEFVTIGQLLGIPGEVPYPPDTEG
jgi:peptidoglycan/xylan/chitin deacetylase (PgdA/CDA1 family)